jgi:hypothetical protein
MPAGPRTTTSMIDFYESGSRKFKWWQDWRGECVAIVASGPSAKMADLSVLKDRIHVIVVNENYQLCPWAEILYSCDADWWAIRRSDVKNFGGIKLTLDDTVQSSKIVGIEKLKIAKHHQIWVDDFLFDKPGEIGSGGNSGFQMINLSAQFGATGIGLIGFDMNMSKGVHWHGMHPTPLRNPDHSRMYEWRKTMDEKAPKLKKYDIDVVNCSMDSAITSFPKMTINQMLERWGL